MDLYAVAMTLLNFFPAEKRAQYMDKAIGWIAGKGKKEVEKKLAEGKARALLLKFLTDIDADSATYLFDLDEVQPRPPSYSEIKKVFTKTKATKKAFKKSSSYGYKVGPAGRSAKTGARQVPKKKSIRQSNAKVPTHKKNR